MMWSINLDRRKEYALQIAWHYLGTWYSWGGDDPSGFDCSRFTGELMKSTGILPRGKPTPIAIEQWEMFKRYKVDKPRLGCLVFFGDPVSHVEFCIDSEFSIGASDGGPHILTKEDATKYNAFIKMRPIKRDRKIKGFVDPFMEV